MSRRQKKLLLRIVIGIALFVCGLFLKRWWSVAFLLAAWAVAGYDVLISAVRNILHGQLFDEKFLMSLATCCAIAMRDFREAAAVMLFFQIGELFELLAVERSRRSISALTQIRPDSAVIIRDGGETEVEPEEVCAGDLLLVRPGERIAVDGSVVEGEGALDTASVTGESVPVDVCAGSRVISGSVNLSGVLKIRAVSAYEHSTVARILTLVESAAEKKASTERMITKFAKYYTPSVIGAAVLLAVIPLFFGQPFAPWLTRALTFLVISCPCALVVSVPMSFFSGMGAAAKLGVMVKGGAALERLAKAGTLVFDKTGTLTEGKLCVQKVLCTAADEQTILQLAARCEKFSNHPAAQAIREACSDIGGEPENVRELPGNGILATLDGKQAAVGNERLMQSLNISVPTVCEPGTTVYVSLDGVCLGAITAADRVRDGVRETINKLRALGVKKTVMLTGDNVRSAEHYAELCGISQKQSELLPQDKVTAVEELLSKKGKKETVVFVGDGVNDAPVLTAADVGIAMGGIGSDAAVEAADAVLLNDDLRKFPALLRIAKRTCAIARQNIVFALTVKAICLLLGALGYAPMWLAIFADVGVAVLAVLNSFRALKSRE